MADTVLFQFLHTEMVAQLWARNPDPRPGVSAGPWGEEARAATERLDGGPRMRGGLSVLESVGFRVGQALGERLPQEALGFKEELDVLKFLCKDLWVAVFRKQMDSPRAPQSAASWPLCSQGTYILQDDSFPLPVPMALGLQYMEEAPKFLAFTCGLLCGVLSTLGFQSLVATSMTALPACE
ncbi:Trafficking protein particle complex subunit 6A, partial [Heterocephalus glaber]